MIWAAIAVACCLVQFGLGVVVGRRLPRECDRMHWTPPPSGIEMTRGQWQTIERAKRRAA